jgi:hypothetical protein
MTMPDRPSDAQGLAAILERQREFTAARLRRARAEGRLVETSIGEQRAAADAEVKAEGGLVSVALGEQGATASVLDKVHSWQQHRRLRRQLRQQRGRPRDYDYASIRAVAQQPEFQHADGKPNISKIARKLGCNRQVVYRAVYENKDF